MLLILIRQKCQISGEVLYYQVTTKVLAVFTSAATFRAAVIVYSAGSSYSGHFLKTNVWTHRPT